MTITFSGSEHHPEHSNNYRRQQTGAFWRTLWACEGCDWYSRYRMPSICPVCGEDTESLRACFAKARWSHPWEFFRRRILHTESRR